MANAHARGLDRFEDLLGGSALERKGRFLLGSGILILVSSCCAFSIYEIDKMVLEQIRLDGRGSSHPQAGEVIVGREGGNGIVVPNRTLDGPLKRAISRGRAELIAFALGASMVAMTYFYMVLRYVLVRSQRLIVERRRHGGKPRPITELYSMLGK